MLLKGLNKYERQIIWRKLHPVDFDLLRCAMNQYRIYSNYGNEEFVMYAVSYGYLELLQMGPIASIESTAVYACIVYGNVAIVKWLLSNGITITENYIELAAVRGRLDIIQYLFEHGHKFSFYMIRKIAEDYGRKNIVEYIDVIKGAQ